MPGRAPAARPAPFAAAPRAADVGPDLLSLAQLAPVPRTPRQPRARHGRSIGPLRASGTRRSPAGLTDHRGHRGRPPWRRVGRARPPGRAGYPRGCGSPMTARLTPGAQGEQLLRVCPERSARAWRASTGGAGTMMSRMIGRRPALRAVAAMAAAGAGLGGAASPARRSRCRIGRHGAAGAEGAGERLRLPHAHLRRPLPGRCQRDVAAGRTPASTTTGCCSGASARRATSS